MSDERRTKADLATELVALRQRVAELEARAADRDQAEAALRDRTEQLRFIFENAFDGISIHEEGIEPDSPRRLLDCNERYAELAGRTQAELLALADTRSIQLPAPPSGEYAASRSGQEAAAVLAAGKPFRGWFSWIRPDGRPNIIEFVAVPLRRGGRILTVGVDRDVTEQMRWEKALRTSERRFRATFDRAAVGIANVALDGSYLRVNRRFCEIVGYAAEELLTRRFHDVTHPDDLQADLDRSRRMIAGEIQAGAAVKRYVRKDGAVVWANMTVSLQRDDAGRPEYFVVVVEDITAREQTEEALRDSEERFRAIFEEAADSVVLLDTPSGAFAEFNSRAHENLGYTREEFATLSLGDIEAIESPADASAHVVKVIREGADQFVTKQRTKTGEIRDVRVSTRRISIRGKDFLLAIWRDITDEKRAEEALRQSEERYRSVYETAPLAVVLWDRDCRVTDWNRQAERVFGWSRDEVLGQDFLGFLTPEADRSRVQEVVAHLLQGALPSHSINQNLTKDGRVITCEWNNAILRDGQGQIVGAISLGLDITERVRAERDQAASLDRIQRQQAAIVQLATSASIARGDFAAAAAEIAETAARALEVDRIGIWLGTREEGLIRCIDFYERPSSTHSAGLILPMDKYPAYFAALESERVIATDNAPDDPRTREFAEGYLRPLGIGSMLDAPIRVSGQLVGSVCHERLGPPRPWLADEVRFAGEIADQAAQALLNAHRRRTEEALRFTQFSVDHAADAAFWVDEDGRFLYVNDAACRFLGYSRAELLALRVPDVVANVPPDQWLTLWHQLKHSGQTTEETVFRAKDGRTFPTEVSLNYVEFEGRPYLCAFARDITERTRAQAERRSLEARIQETARLESLGLLAGGIAHDFNNLLMGVLGNADLALADLSPQSPACESLRDIVTAARRAAELCKQLLAYAGKGRFVVGYIDLNDVVQEMTRLLEVSISKKATLRYHLAPGLPSVEADPTQLRQVLMNLITNASEALGDQSGVIAIATGVVQCTRDDLAAAHPAAVHPDEDLPDGQYVLLEVADTGCGMDNETLARIFDPFFSTKFIGRGLGLAAVRGIVRGHRGTVRVTSEPGKGTTFQILFPAASAPALPAAEARRDPEIAGSGRTILLVDDEDTVRLVAQRMLKRAGFHVLVAADGQQAICLFRQHAAEIACVVLDLTMPHMDGDETYRELRRIRADVPVILSSGFNEQDVVQRFAGTGLAGFVQKPYRMSDLRAAIRAALGKQGKE